MNGLRRQEDGLQFNVSAVDVWTAVHVVVGFLLGFVRIPRSIAYGLIVGVEIVEFVLRRFMDFFKESGRNIFVDLLVGISAYEIGRAFRA